MSGIHPFQENNRNTRLDIAKRLAALWFLGLLASLPGCPPAGPDGGGDGNDGSGGNGLEDAIFVFASNDGSVEMKVDDRLRPVWYSTNELSAELRWSGDSASAQIDVQTAGGSASTDVTFDFSDDALQEALDALETDSGQDLSGLRDWIQQNPGAVLATARGSQTAAQPPDDVSSVSLSKPRPVLQSNLDPNVRRHLDMIANASAKAMQTAFELFRALRRAEQEGPPEIVPVLQQLVNSFVDLRDQLLQYLRDQQDACVACLPDCLVRCNLLETGSCCYFEGGQTRCEDNLTQEECNARNDGIFHSGLGCSVGSTDVCLAACCVTTEAPGVGMISCCTDVYPETCDQIEVGGGNVTTVHDRSRRCGDPEFFCPICEP